MTEWIVTFRVEAPDGVDPVDMVMARLNQGGEADEVREAEQQGEQTIEKPSTRQNPSKPYVLVLVEGGVADIVAGSGVDVDVLDLDNLKELRGMNEGERVRWQVSLSDRALSWLRENRPWLCAQLGMPGDSGAVTVGVDGPAAREIEQ